jgi:hypothetical protein
MTRLHTHGFGSVTDMLQTLTDSGMGAVSLFFYVSVWAIRLTTSCFLPLRQLEMFALGLKATGSYLCRSLSYSGAEFELENCALSDEMSAMYDRSCAFWQMLHNVFNTAASGRCSEGRKVEKSSSVKWAQFWGSHQRFFRQMLLSAKVPHLAKLALEHVHTRNMAVVIGLQSTGESNIGQAMEQMAANGEDIDDFVSAPAVILRNGEFIFISVRTGVLTDVVFYLPYTVIAKQFPTTSAKSTLENETERARWEALYVHVYAMVRRWKQLPTIAQVSVFLFLSYGQ